jgi:iron complex outermembrane recepter protein
LQAFKYSFTVRIDHILVVLVILFLSTRCVGQSLSGAVLDAETAQPLAGAIVEVHEAERHVATGADGRFVVESLVAGHYHVHILMAGYRAQLVDVKVPCEPMLVLLEPTHMELSQVTVESSFSKSSYKGQTQDMVVVDRSDADQNRGITLAQTLSRVPGVQSLQTGVGISKPVIRGLQGNRIVVNDQGLRQEGQQWGADHGLEIDQFAAERIEIVKGPASLQYGSDGLGGVINLLPAAVPKEGVQARVQSIVRTNNDFAGVSAMVEGRKKAFFFRARVTQNRYGDYKVPATSFTYLNRVLPIENGRLRNTAGRELHGGLTLGWATDKGIWRLITSNYYQEAGLFPGIIGIPTARSVSDDGNAFNIDLPRQLIMHSKAALSGNVRLSNGWLQVDGGVQRNLRMEEARPHVDGYGPLPTGITAHRLVLTSGQIVVRRHMTLGKGWKAIPGINAQFLQNSRDGFEFLLPDYSAWNMGAWYFAERTDREGKRVVNGGVRYDAGHITSRPFRSQLYNAQQEVVGEWLRAPGTDRLFHNVSAAFGAAWTLAHEVHLKVNVGKTFRLPNGAELLSNGIHHGTYRHEQGTATLRAEHGYQVDMSVSKEEKNWMARFTPYFNVFEGYIYLRPSAQFSQLPDGGQVYVYTQNDAIFTGAECSFEWHPVKALHLESASDYVFSYNLQSGLALPFTPPFRSRLNAQYEWEGEETKAYVGCQGTLMADQGRVDRNEWETPGYGLVDAFAGVEWKWRKWLMELRLAGNNLTNRRFMNHMSVYRALLLPEQGRNITLSLLIAVG